MAGFQVRSFGRCLRGRQKSQALVRHQGMAWSVRLPRPVVGGVSAPVSRLVTLPGDCAGMSGHRHARLLHQGLLPLGGSTPTRRSRGLFVCAQCPATIPFDTRLSRLKRQQLLRRALLTKGAGIAGSKSCRHSALPNLRAGRRRGSAPRPPGRIEAGEYGAVECRVEGWAPGVEAVRLSFDLEPGSEGGWRHRSDDDGAAVPLVVKVVRH